MREFKVNEFLSLHLEDEQIIIYVKGQIFKQCVFLLLNIDVDEMSTFDEIDSIDEAAEKLNTSLEYPDKAYEFEIPIEVEFWGHCSNLQVWYEHDYDTRLIHSNLAFPLLRKLTEVGDPLAKKVFKREIIKRYENGTDATRGFLLVEQFLDYFTIDEQLQLMLNDDYFTASLEISEKICLKKPLITGGPYNLLLDMIDHGYLKIKNRQIIEFNFRNLGMQEFHKSIVKLKSLEVLSLSKNGLKELPQDIDKLSNLKELWLTNNQIEELPDSFCNLKNLEIAWIDGNKIKKLPNNIGNLIKLKQLMLSGNSLKKLPNSICKLKNLEYLSLSNNLLEELPNCLTELTSLKFLNLRKNPFSEYSEILKKMENVKEIRIN